MLSVLGETSMKRSPQLWQGFKSLGKAGAAALSLSALLSTTLAGSESARKVLLEELGLYDTVDQTIEPDRKESLSNPNETDAQHGGIEETIQVADPEFYEPIDRIYKDLTHKRPYASDVLLEYEAERIYYERFLDEKLRGGRGQKARDMIGVLLLPDQPFIVNSVIDTGSWWSSGQTVGRFAIAWRSPPLETRVIVFKEMVRLLEERTSNQQKIRALAHQVVYDALYDEIIFKHRMYKAHLVFIVIIIFAVVYYASKMVLRRTWKRDIEKRQVGDAEKM